MPKRSLDRINVIDVEATCWQGNPPPKQESEIIEIGITVLDCKDRNNFLRGGMTTSQRHAGIPPIRESKRSILIKPTQSKVSEFCTKLTTITQDMLDKDGISFYDACKILRKEYNSDITTWASYGDYDRKIFERNCKSKNVRYPFGPRHINVKNLFAHMWGLEREVGMHEALEILELKLEGTHHRGHDDAWNIAGILYKILECR